MRFEGDTTKLSIPMAVWLIDGVAQSFLDMVKYVDVLFSRTENSKHSFFRVPFH